MQQRQKVASLTEIESTIQQFSKDEIRQLVERFQAYLETEWDRQIEADVNNGKLNSLIADAGLEASYIKSLDEVINNV